MLDKVLKLRAELKRRTNSPMVVAAGLGATFTDLDAAVVQLVDAQRLLALAVLEAKLCAETPGRPFDGWVARNVAAIVDPAKPFDPEAEPILQGGAK